MSQPRASLAVENGLVLHGRAVGAPGERAGDLYRVIASGVGGTAMPAWKGSLPEDDLWALVHYVDSLVAMRDRAEAAELRRRNEADDASWKPPAPPGEGAR